MKELYNHFKGMMSTEQSYINVQAINIKSLLLLCSMAVLISLASCGRVETPEEFFDITGVQGDSGFDGSNGVDGSFEGDFEYVVVCPEKKTRAHMETLILLNGQYLAFFSNGAERLSILDESVTYRTTDGRHQDFSIENGEIVCQ